MELKISREVLDLADRCSRGHRCLTGIRSEPQVQLIGAKRFVCRDPEPCEYKFPFGSNFFCTCPVRQAIYDKYGK
ncbi:MAG: hypothetical protein WC334_10970 [Kiritimatiellales bacterium]